jgi:hypothetical protein
MFKYQSRFKQVIKDIAYSPLKGTRQILRNCPFTPRNSVILLSEKVTYRTSIYVPIHLFTYLYACLCSWLYSSARQSIYPCIHLSVHSSKYLSTYPSKWSMISPCRSKNTHILYTYSTYSGRHNPNLTGVFSISRGELSCEAEGLRGT